MLYLIGLGLGDVKDISVRGLEAVQACDKEEFYGRSIELADREFVEQGCDSMLDAAVDTDVALLVVGDPFGATTHSDLQARAFARNIKVSVIHNASIMNACGCCGLQLYNFGATVSVCFWTDDWTPDSYFDKILSNFGLGLHTLCLLDIKVKEQTVENLIGGRAIFEPPSYMTVAQAASQFIQIILRKRESGEKTEINEDTKCVGLARVGWPDQKLMFGSLKELSECDLGSPLHSLIVCGKLHDIELEILNRYKC